MKNRKKKEGQARKLAAAAAAAAAAAGGGGPAAPAPPAEESELCSEQSEGGAVEQTGAVGVEVAGVGQELGLLVLLGIELDLNILFLKIYLEFPIVAAKDRSQKVV